MDRSQPATPSPETPSPPSFVDDLAEALFPAGSPLPLSRRTVARIVDTYDYTLRRLGPHPKSVLWRSGASQRLRFAKLLGILGRDRWRRGQVINDFGCGYGALFPHIRRRWFLRGGAYYGYDLCPRMIRAARQRIRDPRATFIEATEPTREADYTLCSGTFGLKLDTPEADWRLYVQDSLRRAAARSRKGLAFNLLSATTPAAERQADLYYAEAADYLDFCRVTFAGEVTLLDRYTEVDFTIWVRFTANGR